MKLRAFTFAAAGLLAAAFAHAELQTWRYSGLLMNYGALAPSKGGITVPPESMQFDLTFDTAAVATGSTYAAALTNVVINGETYWPYSLYDQSLVAGTPFTQLSVEMSSYAFGNSLLRMQAPAPVDTATQTPRPITSVGEFLKTTDQQIDQIYQDFVQDGSYTWRELVDSPLMWDVFPQISMYQPTGDSQVYALIGAHNITPGVPEPSSWALALLGGISAIALARRRQSARQAEALPA